MTKAGLLLLPVLLLTLSCEASRDAPARRERPVGYPSLGEPASCASYGAIDREALARLEKRLPEQLDRAAVVRSKIGTDLTPPRGYDAGRIVLTNLRYGWVHDEAIVAFAASGGRWWVRSITVGDHDDLDGPMPAAAAAELNAALAQSCLWTEPTYMPNPVPLKIGRDFEVSDGASFVLEIELPGHRRAAYQIGNVWGYTGAARHALYHAIRPPPPE